MRTGSGTWRDRGRRFAQPFGKPRAQPVAGETFVFTQFSGEPQVFLTGEQLFEEMSAAGFETDPGVTLTEYNRPRPGALRMGGPPVIYEAAFRKVM